MKEDQEIRAAALQAAATLYGQLAAGKLDIEGDPADLQSAATATESLARQFARYIQAPVSRARPSSRG